MNHNLDISAPSVDIAVAAKATICDLLQRKFSAFEAQM